MFQRRYMCRELWIVVYVFWNNIYDFISDKTSYPIYLVMQDKIGGIVSIGDMSLFVLNVEKLGFLFLYLTLFANYIPTQIKQLSYYLFSRISDRRSWFLHTSLHASFFTLTYVALFEGGNLFFSIYLSYMKLSLTDIKYLIILFIYLYLEISFFTKVFGMLCMKYDEPIAFFLTSVIIVVFVLLSIRFANETLLFLNPFSFCLAPKVGPQQWMKLLYLAMLNVFSYLIIEKEVCLYECA